MKVSVISPCRNEAAHIDGFLRSAVTQECHGFDLEIIIADGLSDDGTSEKLAEWMEKDSRISVIRNPEKIVSTGLNRAIAAAAGQIIVRMDIHTTYAADYISQCVAVLQSTGAQCAGGPWFAEGETIKQKAIAAAFQSRFGSGGAASRRRDYSGPVDTVYLGAWWKADLEKLGGFDEELVRNQDDELCLRITRSGGRIWQSSTIRSSYTPRNSLGMLLKQFHQYGYWKALILKKHHIPASPRHLVPSVFVLGLAALLVAAPFWHGAGVLFLLTFSAYLLAVSIFASLARSNGLPASALPFIAAAFCAMHFGYGVGFARGLIDFILFNHGPHKSMRRLTR